MNKLLGVLLVVLGVSAALANDGKPIVHIQDWNDIACPTGKIAIIKIDPTARTVSVFCE